MRIRNITNFYLKALIITLFLFVSIPGAGNALMVPPGKSYSTMPLGTSSSKKPLQHTSTGKTSSEDSSSQQWGSTQGLVDTVLPSRQKVDYSKVVNEDTDVLMFGESHGVMQTKEEISKNMKLFKELGFTHIGLEMFQADAQNMLDEYYKTGNNREEVVSYLKDKWGWPGTTEKYMNIIDAAKKHGIKIVALDAPKEQLSETDDVVEETKVRNKFMCKRIQNILSQNENNKMITLNGTAHSGYGEYGMATMMEEQYGKEVSSVSFVGGKRKVELNDGTIVNKGSYIEQAVREAGLAESKFMLKREGGDSGVIGPPCDYLVHLPQTESPSRMDIAFATLPSPEFPGSKPKTPRKITPPTEEGYEDKPVSLFPSDLMRASDEKPTGIAMHKDGKRFLFITGEKLKIHYYEKVGVRVGIGGDWTIKDRYMSIEEYHEFKDAIEKRIQENPRNTKLQELYGNFPTEPPEYLLEETPEKDKNKKPSIWFPEE